MKNTSIMDNVMNIFLLLFFTTILTIKNSYYIAPLCLVLISILYFVYEYKNIYIHKALKMYILSVISYYFICFYIAFINDDAIPSSFKADHFLLLSIPIILLLLKYKPNFYLLNVIFPVSNIIYGITSIYNKFFIGIERAFYDIHPIPAGAIIITVTLYCFTLGFHAISKKNFKIGYFLLISALIGLIGNILTGSRGTWIIFPVAIVIFIYIYGTQLKNVFFTFLTIVITVTTVASFIPQSGLQKRYHEAISDITQYFDGTNKETSLGMRFELWRSAWQAIQEKPLLGWGKRGMDNKRLEQSKTGDFPASIKDFPHTHNLFIEQTFYRGIIGLFALIFLIGTLLSYFINLYKNTHDDEKRVIALLGIINVLALLSFSLSDALLIRLKEYAMFFYMSNAIFYTMTLPKREN